MSERVIRFTETHSLDKDAALAGLEAIDDLLDAQSQLIEGLGEFAEAEVISIKTGERLSLKEKYETIYSPERTIPELGRLGMATVLQFPQMEQVATEKTVKVVDKGAEVIDLSAHRESKEQPAVTQTIYRENGLAYAQDQPETRGYTASATSIIDALMNGNETLLAALPARFQEALSVRIASYEGDVPVGEYEAMISVACNGLAEANGKLELTQAA